MEESKKRKRKNFFRRTILISGIFCVFALFGLAAFFFLPDFQIKEIDVQGNKKISDEDITANILTVISGRYFLIFPKDNIFIVSEEEIEQILTSVYPALEEIYLKKRFPAKLLVNVREREPIAVLCKGQQCAFIDSSGYVFERAPYFSGGVFLKFIDNREENKEIQFKSKFIDMEEYRKILEFKNKFSRTGLETNEVVLEKDGVYRFITNEGWFVLLNDRSDLESPFDNFVLALNSEIKEKRADLEYIDLRFGNKVYYKFKN